MKVLIVSAWDSRFESAYAARLPPLTAPLLAALCPPHVEARVWHEQFRPLDLNVAAGADLIALSGMTGSAERIYRLADRLRERGKTVVLGGPHVSLVPGEAMRHADAIVFGDGDRTFPHVIRDFERHNLRALYRDASPCSLAGLPVPRYDLYEDFPLRCFVQATRGCPHDCSFCSMKGIDRSFRVRPLDEVIRDIESCHGRGWIQDKIVIFWDDNLTADKAYAKDLFRRLRPLKRWWYAQCSIDLARDPELVRLAAESGCMAIFVGFESFNAESLDNLAKRHNKVAHYRRAIQSLHDHGIGVHAGLVIGIDGDTPATLRRIPQIVDELGIDFPFLNILTPFPGTPLYERLLSEGRVLGDAGWARFNAGHAVFHPLTIAADELEQTFLELRQEIYSTRSCLRRMWRSARHGLPSAFLGGMLNGSYALDAVLPDAIRANGLPVRVARRGDGTSRRGVRRPSPRGTGGRLAARATS
jgi:radical SAM superfamily enzyme YgiQ (UPF0313 family)